ncbi:hypothetical protein LEP1GSC188_3964 [Leptospira weilii serovar Topaz str. LT2116]|uniref:Uncharacterized protein n=1 Tax=Leptospira weilii serovar Topaz str. LT2116 TaxID=1088540 RepID=M3GVY9_9LEPT|nr:hypothetical protein LEP1GSC188_3964 [Leptospira weilii serovar Topaz str. LT2116]
MRFKKKQGGWNVRAVCFTGRGGSSSRTEERKLVQTCLRDVFGYPQLYEILRKKSPREVVDYLNHIFSYLIDIVNVHNGMINKFLGAPVRRSDFGRR